MKEQLDAALRFKLAPGGSLPCRQPPYCSRGQWSCLVTLEVPGGHVILQASFLRESCLAWWTCDSRCLNNGDVDNSNTQHYVLITIFRFFPPRLRLLAGHFPVVEGRAFAATEGSRKGNRLSERAGLALGCRFREDAPQGCRFGCSKS